ncbi:hypothetical protein GOODEAATRI_014142 [Goodea atripinnis]|uniref:Uncharacterized protein n=1 Tax=Goodea atripinnis TaxID=208336 RepID=A0ABV0PE78_9TELE
MRFSSVLLWSIQVCCNTMPGRKYINNDITNTTAHQSGKHFSNKIRSIILERDYIKTFQIVSSFPGVDVPADSPQGQSVKLREMTNKSSILDSRSFRVLGS